MDYERNNCWSCYFNSDNKNPVDDGYDSYYSCCTKCLVNFSGKLNHCMNQTILRENGGTSEDCMICGFHFFNKEAVAFCDGCVKKYRRVHMMDGECLVCHFEKTYTNIDPDDFDPDDFCTFCSHCIQNYAPKQSLDDKNRFSKLLDSIHNFSFDDYCQTCSRQGTSYKVRICDRHYYTESVGDGVVTV